MYNGCINKIRILKRVIKLFVFLSFLIINKVSANVIDKIEMDIYIDKNGNAEITEVWKTSLTSGTEGYRKFTNLNNSSISNFSVTDDTGMQYEKLSYWDRSASFDSKKYKNGIYNIKNGVELCWGISKYGNRIFTLQYTINNIITQYVDSQGLYFNFLNLDQPINHGRIVIHSDYLFTSSDTKIWSFGNNGIIYFDKGKIVLDSNGYLSNSQYMVVLVKFEEKLFNTNNYLDMNFKDIYENIMDEVNDEIDNNVGNSIAIKERVLFFQKICIFMIVGGISLIIYFTFKTFGGKCNLNFNSILGNPLSDLNFGPNGKKIPDDKDINYWRDIPCDKDLTRAYWVLLKFDIVTLDLLNKTVIGAFLLKWIKDGKIRVINTKNVFPFFNQNKYAIEFININNIDNKLESELLSMLRHASGANDILETREFEKWCKTHYRLLDEWFSSIVKNVEIELQNQGLLSQLKPKEVIMDDCKVTLKQKDVSEKLREEAIRLKGLKKFLLQFSLVEEKEYFNVHLLEEYLIFAQLFGIADKVLEQFSGLYPDISRYNDLCSNSKIVENIVDRGYKCMQFAQRREIQREERSDFNGDTNYSIGDGGRSYPTGGRSSGGSSGGGFR